MPMRPIDIASAILVAALWGANFVSAKFGMAHFPPFMLTCLRFTFVALALLPFAARPSRAQLIAIAQLALVLGVCHFALMFAALYFGLDIASCTIIAQLGVPFSCLLGALLHHDRLGPWRMGGMIVAFAGMMIVAGTPNILQHPPAFVIALAGAFCWGASNIMIKRIQGLGNFSLLGWMAAFSVPQLALISAIFEHDQWALLGSAPVSAWLSVAYTVICSTMIAYSLWYRLLQRHPVTQVAPYSLLTPVFAIALGQYCFTEALTWQVIGGGLVTIAGVAVIVIRRPKLAAWSEAT